jgi:hypothetical protein
MGHTIFGTGIVILLAGYVYVCIRRYQSSQVISTTEWLRLMREKKLENDRTTKAERLG